MIKKDFLVLVTVAVIMIAALSVSHLSYLKLKAQSYYDEFKFEFVHEQQLPGVEIIKEDLVFYKEIKVKDKETGKKKKKTIHLWAVQKKNLEKNELFVVVPGFPKDDYKKQVQKNSPETSIMRTVPQSEQREITRLLRKKGFKGTILFW